MKKAKDTLNTFLVRMQDSNTTVPELALKYWDLINKYEELEYLLEDKELEIKILERGCACLRNSRMEKK